SSALVALASTHLKRNQRLALSRETESSRLVETESSCPAKAESASANRVRPGQLNNEKPHCYTCYPQSNGRTKVVNKILSQLLRCFVGKSLKSWKEWLPHLEFAFNRVVNTTTSHSPFELVYGFNPLSPMDLLPLPYATSMFHEKSCGDMERKGEQYAKIANKVCRQHYQTPTLEGSFTRGSLRRIQEEVQHMLTTLKDQEEGQEVHTLNVHEILRKQTMFPNLDKWIFCTNEVVFIGFVVGSHGVKLDNKKVKAIQEWPMPKNYWGMGGGLRERFPRVEGKTQPSFNSCISKLLNSFDLECDA
ncbi:hypothetical protein CR513_01072, partial [Mucuna pruriens]